MNDAFANEQNQAKAGTVGPRTRVDGSAQIQAARIGEDCDIGAGAFLGVGATVGDRVIVERGVQLWPGVELEDDVFVGPAAVFAGPAPPPREEGSEAGSGTVVRAGASVGANATVLGGLEIGRGARVSAGAVVTESVPPHAVVSGNPARIEGYIDAGPATAKGTTQVDAEPGTTPLGVRGVHLQRFDEFSDLRGRLTAGDLPSEGVPFVPQRWFLVYDVPSREVRGAHAHRLCHQFLICVSGHVHVAVDDGEQRGEVLLDEPTIGLYVPPLVWASQYRYDERTVLLALASHPYDPDDYIREYDVFLAEAADVEGSNHRSGSTR